MRWTKSNKVGILYKLLFGNIMTSSIKSDSSAPLFPTDNKPYVSPSEPPSTKLKDGVWKIISCPYSIFSRLFLQITFETVFILKM